jgi:hypothetical protein
MLRKLGLWNSVRPKAVQGKDVREVLTKSRWVMWMRAWSIAPMPQHRRRCAS